MIDRHAMQLIAGALLFLAGVFVGVFVGQHWPRNEPSWSGGHGSAGYGRTSDGKTHLCCNGQETDCAGLLACEAGR